MATASQRRTQREGIVEMADAISDMLRSIANPARIQILATSDRGDASLKDLVDITGLSKTAVMNHLVQLTDAGLVERVSRGAYQTTQDGRSVLSSASDAYLNSVRRSKNERAMVSKSFAVARAGLAEPESVELKKVDFVPCWLSYLGAMAGALKYLGVRSGPMEVGGHSGYAFLVNVAKGETCPSGPTALHLRTFREMVHGTEDLGWAIDSFSYEQSYPRVPGKPTSEEIALVKGLFRRIKKEVDVRRRPVVLWGLVAPEYGLVKGYVGESYLVSTFRGLSNPGKPEDPVPYHDLKAPGCIDAFFFEEKRRVNPAKARRDALQRAIDFASGNVDVQKNYVAGPAAFEEWAGVLESGSPAQLSYMGNSYVAGCIHEGRVLSGQFLKHLAKKMPSSQARYLLDASRTYERGAKQMASFTKLFPFAFEGQMPAEKRRKGAQILRQVRANEERAVRLMKRA